MPPVKVCPRCGNDVRLGQRCAVCEPAQRAARRHPGYDDPTYRRYRRRCVGKKCERCNRRLGAILHHNDGDPGNNRADGSNYTWACDECAKVLDARMRDDRRRRRGGGQRSPWK